MKYAKSIGECPSQVPSERPRSARCPPRSLPKRLADLSTIDSSASLVIVKPSRWSKSKITQELSRAPARASNGSVAPALSFRIRRSASRGRAVFAAMRASSMPTNSSLTPASSLAMIAHADECSCASGSSRRTPQASGSESTTAARSPMRRASLRSIGSIRNATSVAMRWRP
jgi:hypothetical protein